MGICARITLAAGLLALCLPQWAAAQPPWLDHPIAQPYTDAPWYARFNPCATPPPVWSCDPDEDPCANGCYRPAHSYCGWYASAAVAPLFYNACSGTQVARVGQTSNVGLTTNDLKTEFGLGGKYTLGTAVGDCGRIEGTYLGGYDWHAFAAARNRNPNNVGGFGNFSSVLSNFSNPTEVAALDYNNLATLRLGTTLTSGELNAKRRIELQPGPHELWIYAGGRYADITEDLAFHTESTVPTTNDLAIHTTNQLWGGQLGFQSKFLVNRYFWFDTDVKGGLCSNTFSASRTYTTNAIGPVFQNATDHKTSAFGDVSILAHLQLRDHVVLQWGYQALFIGGLALAQDQIPNDAAFIVPGPFDPYHKQTAIYHGPVLGLVIVR